MIFIDTNYFLRLFIDESSQQHKKVTTFFFKAATEKNAYMTSTLVIFEVYWVLKRFYKLEKHKLIGAIEAIMKMNFIVYEDRLILLKALSRFSQCSLSLEDCFHLELAKTAHCTDIATFDTKLARAFED